MAKRTIEEIIELGQDAIGDQVALLVAGGRQLDQGEARMLCDYLKAALFVRKDAREQALMKNLGDVRDADLMKMIAGELGISVSKLQDFIAETRADGARAS
jgi:hypothetical protein